MQRNRKHIRKFVEFPVSILQLTDGKTGRPINCVGFLFEAKNFSIGGLGLETNMPMQVGSHALMNFVLPGEKRRLSVEGTVQSVTPVIAPVGQPKAWVVGFKFVNVNPLDAIYMSNYMTGTFLLF